MDDIVLFFDLLIKAVSALRELIEYLLSLFSLLGILTDPEAAAAYPPQGFTMLTLSLTEVYRASNDT